MYDSGNCNKATSRASGPTLASTYYARHPYVSSLLTTSNVWISYIGRSCTHKTLTTRVPPPTCCYLKHFVYALGNFKSKETSKAPRLTLPGTALDTHVSVNLLSNVSQHSTSACARRTPKKENGRTSRSKTILEKRRSRHVCMLVL